MASKGDKSKGHAITSELASMIANYLANERHFVSDEFDEDMPMGAVEDGPNVKIFIGSDMYVFEGREA